MPLIFLNSLGARDRTPRSNRQLGFTLAFVAGAINAGGFLAVHRYTSHMTGFVSALADHLVLGDMALALGAAAFLAAFTAGAALTAVLVNWARHRALHSEYALPLLVEAVLLLVFALAGPGLDFDVGFLVPVTVLLLCFLMGLQNAVLTKLSRAEIRTTHMTGILTDIGIAMGRAAYFNRDETRRAQVRADRDRLLVLCGILTLFLSGGIAGAAAFRVFGFFAMLPFSALLLAISAAPLTADLRSLLAAIEGG